MERKRESFGTIMNRIARRHGVHSVFSDFVTMCVCAFSHGKMEDQYLETIRKYEKPEAYAFSEALGALVVEMTGDDGLGLVDVLGSYFEENISHGNNGQFFTPQPVCDMMAMMNEPMRMGERVLDPACGSGRMLLGMAKRNRFMQFYGADNDVLCAKMTVVNLCLNGLFGEVAWMNSLTNQFYGAWEIYPTVKNCPCIREIGQRESRIHLKLQEGKPERKIERQQLLFEF